MTGFFTINAQTSKLRRMNYSARIKAAINDLKSQDHSNITATAIKWKVARETLLKRFRGETISYQEVISQIRKNLIDV